MATLVELTMTDGSKVSVNMDRVTFFYSPDNRATFIKFANDHGIEVTESYDIVRSRWLAQRKA